MKAKCKQHGLSLMEMAVVIAAIALLVGLGVPAARALLKSFETEGGAKSMISAALASARAIAAKEQHYAGVRFQKAYQPEGPLNAAQYMIFIVHDSDKEPNGTGLANGFRAVEGLKPIKLPETVGVMDLRYRTSLSPIYPDDAPIDENADISSLARVRDTTTFSIIFSPSGKLVIHEVRVKNKNGNDTSNDDVFNTAFNVETNKIAMFYEDDDPSLGLGQEYSRHSFIIYDTREFKKAYLNGQAWSEYLSGLEPVYINPYMGTIINQ